MRRNSTRALAITEGLAARDLTIAPRRLERWAADDLVPLPGADEELDHYACLAHLATSGRDTDNTALRLAAHGHPCRRLRPALLKVLGLSAEPPTVVALDLSNEASGDEHFHEVEIFATQMRATRASLPKPLQKVIAAMESNARRLAAEYGESAETLFHSFIVNGVCYMLGDDLYHAAALGATTGIAPSELHLEVLDALNAGPRLTQTYLENVARNAPLEAIAQRAAWLRSKLPGLAELLGPMDLTDDDLDLLAAYYAPVTFFLEDALTEREQAALELPTGTLTAAT